MYKCNNSPFSFLFYQRKKFSILHLHIHSKYVIFKYQILPILYALFPNTQRQHLNSSSNAENVLHYTYMHTHATLNLQIPGITHPIITVFKCTKITHSNFPLTKQTCLIQTRYWDHGLTVLK